MPPPTHLSPRSGLTRRLSFAGRLLAALVGPLSALGAENYTLNLNVKSGGGGLSRGATFSVGGTVGEPGAGPVLSGPKTYTLVSGYWSVVTAVQKTLATASSTTSTLATTMATVDPMVAVAPERGLPAPGIGRQPDGLVLSWPTGAGALTLETTADVTPPIRWSVVGETMVVSNGLNRVPVQVTGTQQFFRLRAVGAGR